MTYRIEVVVDAAKGEQGIASVKSTLADLDRKANQTIALMDKVFDGLAAEAPAAVSAAKKVTEQLDREAKILKAINGPMDEYIADVRALNALWAKGAITASQYNAQLERSDKAAGITATAPKRGLVGRGMDALGPLAPAAGAAGALYAAKGVADLSDAYTTLQNRLGTVSSATATTAELSDRLFGIAQRTRSEWGAVSEVFVRTSNALEGLGYSTDQTLQFTETLSKAVKISGASATEANAAMIQLSQGLSSGTLRGDELRSVLEQLPTVADVIAKSLGVTRGELRKLGEDGKISTSQIIDAFAKAKGDIDAKFGKTVPTIAEQFAKLKNVVVKAIGDMAPVLGGMIDILGVTLSALGKVIATAAKVAGAIGEVGSALGFSDSRIGASNIKYGDFGKVLGAVKVKYSELNLETVDAGVALEGTEIRLFRVTAQLVAMQAKAEALKPTVNSLTEAMNSMKTATALAFAEFAKANATEAKRIIDLKLELDRLLDAADPAGAALRKFGKDAETVALNVAAGTIGIFEAGRALAFLGGQAKDKLGKDAADAAKKGADAFKQLMERVRGYRDEVDAVGAAQRALAEVQRDLTKAVERDRITQAEAADIYERKAFLLRDQLDPLGAVTDAIKAQITAAEGLNAAQRASAEYAQIEIDLYTKGIDVTEAWRRSTLDLLRAKEMLADGPASLELGGTPGVAAGLSIDEIIKREQAKTDAIKASSAAAMSAKDDAAKAAQDFEQSFDSIYRNATDVASATAAAWTGAFSTMEDALVKFVTTGKIDFHAMTQSILADITRILLRQALVAAFGRPADAAGAGGTASLLGGLLGFASGGSFTVGGNGGTDTTPVMFRATPGERVIVQTPAQQAAASSPMYMPAPVINNTVVMNADQMLQVLRSPGGKRELTEAIRANPQLFKAALR